MSMTGKKFPELTLNERGKQGLKTKKAIKAIKILMANSMRGILSIPTVLNSSL